ncbi:hypothetical protein [Streptomyces sp. NPDC093225]|uniref:hypothetical protein n=1 Tax=Streptomyces sp. NPDC093225 TaxID=3366034 RepID=UPI00380C61AB
MVGGLAWLAARRRRGAFAISGGLLAVQGALHLLFAATEGPGSASAGASSMHMDMGGGDMSGMDMGATSSMHVDMGTDAGAPSMAGLADMAGMAGHGGLGMLAAHVLAGLFCAFWLARGEAALFRLARVVALRAAAPLRRALAFVLLLVRAVPVAVPPRRPRPYAGRPRRLRGALPAHTLVRRGPPGFRAPSATAPGRPALA